MTDPDPLRAWLTAALGHAPQDIALFRRALTHSSHGDPDYQRLEFLGDRVLGLTAATWLFALGPRPRLLGHQLLYRGPYDLNGDDLAVTATGRGANSWAHISIPPFVVD